MISVDLGDICQWIFPAIDSVELSEWNSGGFIPSHGQVTYCIILWIDHGWILYIPSLVGYFVSGDWDMMKKSNYLSIIGILNMGYSHKWNAIYTLSS